MYGEHAYAWPEIELHAHVSTRQLQTRGSDTWRGISFWLHRLNGVCSRVVYLHHFAAAMSATGPGTKVFAAQELSISAPCAILCSSSVDVYVALV